jgi:hypothetical protein
MTSLWLRSLVCVFGVCWTAVSNAETDCKVDFIQGEVKVQAVKAGGWNLISLAKKPFQISISPPECRPSLATLQGHALLEEISTLPELVFAHDGTGFAGRSEDADVLHWPSRTPIKIQLKEISTDWAVVDTFKAESNRLRYQLQPIQAWGSASVFQVGLKGSSASFRRLTQQIDLNSEMPSITLPAVIYLKVKDLMKPTWFDAVAPYYLVQPYKVLFTFN